MEDEEIQKFFRKLKAEEEEIDIPAFEEVFQKPKVKRPYLRYAVAASILFLIGTSIPLKKPAEPISPIELETSYGATNDMQVPFTDWKSPTKELLSDF